MVADKYDNTNGQVKIVQGYDQLHFDLADRTNDVICLFDVTYKKLLYASPSFEFFWGMSIEEVEKNPLLIKKMLNSADANKLFQMFLSPSRSTDVLEYKINGEGDRWYRTTMIPIIDASGKINKSISITKDITQWKQRGQQEVKITQMGLLAHIAAAFAHEIRNPLTTIKGFMQLLGMDRNNRYHQIILQETSKIEAIIDEFLMLAQPYPKNDFVLTHMNGLISEIYSKVSPQALRKNIDIFVRTGTDLPAIMCSPNQIKQAFLNLITNSFQAMAEGGRIDIILDAADGNQVSIKIKDDGIGIPQDKLERLGIPYYSNKKEGAGVGIMICCQIIHNHGGTIQFSSEVGKGTIVEILLPAKY